MNLMNYHLYANTAMMPQIMAEDAGAAELRNPVFYIRTEYKYGWLGRLREEFAKKKCTCRPMNISAAMADM